MRTLESHNDDVSQHTLVLIGCHIVSGEIKSGVITKRQDMKTTQEGAANMIIQQVAEGKDKNNEELVVVH